MFISFKLVACISCRPKPSQCLTKISKRTARTWLSRTLVLGSCQLLQFLQCFEWMTLRMTFPDKLLNWILNWIILLASRLCSLWSPCVKTFTLKLHQYEFWAYICNRHFAVLSATGKWSGFNIINSKENCYNIVNMVCRDPAQGNSLTISARNVFLPWNKKHSSYSR